MKFRLRQWLSLYQYCAGLCDAGTGLLLVGFPSFTFHLLGFNVVPQPIVFARFPGVFVLAVGLTYLWTVTRWPLNEHTAVVWITQWKITALIRMLVAALIVWHLMAQAIESRWMTVGITDGILATVQIIGLEQGWIERAV